MDTAGWGFVGVGVLAFALTEGAVVRGGEEFKVVVMVVIVVIVVYGPSFGRLEGKPSRSTGGHCAAQPRSTVKCARGAPCPKLKPLAVDSLSLLTPTNPLPPRLEFRVAWLRPRAELLSQEEPDLMMTEGKR